MLSQAAMENKQGLPSTEKICPEKTCLCLKGFYCSYIMAQSFTDSWRTSIYEGSTAGHRQSDTWLFTLLVRSSPEEPWPGSSWTFLSFCSLSLCQVNARMSFWHSPDRVWQVALQCLFQLEDLNPFFPTSLLYQGYSIEKGLNYDDIHLQRPLIWEMAQIISAVRIITRLWG